MIKKAVIPAAGLATRVLPATKSMPKEMLPIVDKPAIQYLVEEAAAAGIEDILIITNRGKNVIEDHFDRSIELELRLEQSGRQELLEQINRINSLCNIHYIRQIEIKGLGHAILQARSFVGREPFAVLYGDDVVIGKTPATGELCQAYERYNKPVVGIKPVKKEEISKYCSVDIEKIGDRIFNVFSMVEKPKPEEVFSLYSILGRTVLTHDIFEILEATPPGAGGEIQLTDALNVLCQRTGCIGVEYTGKRYDMGNKLGILEANIEVGLSHPETAEGLKNIIKNIAKSL